MNYLIAAGGTGGHVYPAIAISKAIVAKDPKAKIIFVGTRSGFEATIVPEAGFPIEFMEIGGLHSKDTRTKMKNLLALPRAFALSNDLLNRYRPVGVFGIGGYTSGPLLMLAALKRVHTGILEPNAIAGRTNRFLGQFVERVFVSFEEAKIYFNARKCSFSGNPIRPEILKIQKPDFSTSRKSIFVFGGSQGATKINQAVLGMIQSDPEYWRKYAFIHQTGPNDFDDVKKTYHRLNIEADVRRFFHKISEPYEKCHFVIARSGSSVTEIAAIGRPSVLIPYPYAADNHQDANARIYEKAGSALVIEDSSCTGEYLGRLIRPILQSTEKLEDMSAKALRMRLDQAAFSIADEMLAWGAQ